MRGLNGPRRLLSDRALLSGGWYQTPFEHLFSIAAQFWRTLLFPRRSRWNCMLNQAGRSAGTPSDGLLNNVLTSWRAVLVPLRCGRARGAVPANTPKHVEREPIEGFWVFGRRIV
jgi:hypothetical protein